MLRMVARPRNANRIAVLHHVFRCAGISSHVVWEALAKSKGMGIDVSSGLLVRMNFEVSCTDFGDAISSGNFRRMERRKP